MNVCLPSPKPFWTRQTWYRKVHFIVNDRMVEEWENHYKTRVVAIMTMAFTVLNLNTMGCVGGNISAQPMVRWF